MVGATRLPTGPTVRADPFIVRALNNSQQSMLVGRQEVASLIIDQMTHGTPAAHLIVGPSGSGRTSLLNCLAPEDSRHIGNIWTEETKITGVIHEAVAKFTNQFQIPPTLQSSVDYLRNHLEGRTGHLDLIAFDYPYIPNSDLLAIVQNIVPALKTMRAITVVSMSDTQYHDLGQYIEGSFEWVHHLLPLSLEETRMLVDLRMNSVSHETILKQGDGISRLHSYTGGNPKEIVRQCGLHLRHLRFPDRGPPAPFMNQQLPISSSIQSNIGGSHSSSSRMGPRPEPQRPLFPSTTVVPVQVSPPHSREVIDDGYDAWFADSKVENQPSESFESNHIEVSSVDIEDDNRPLFESIDDDPYGGIGFDPEVIHIADKDEAIDFDESQVLYLETEEMESEPQNTLDLGEEVFDDSYEATDSNDSELLPMDSGPVSDIHATDMYAETDVNISSEPIGLEPSSDFELPEPEVTIQRDTVNVPGRPRSGISGLADRMREANVRMDLAPRAPPTEIIEAIDWGPEEESKDVPLPSPEAPESTPVTDARPQMRTIDPMTSRPPDIDEDGAQLWMDPSLTPPSPAVPDYSPTVPTTPTRGEFTPPEDPVGQNRPIFNARKVIDGIHAIRKARWEPDEPLDPARLKTMSEADVQILTAAAEREVSPSDIALQARLQVGRSRLSQRFNDLNRTGYLSVRTEGRSRYYRLTEAASSLFSEVNE